MNLKQFLLANLALLLAGSVNAQDNIQKRNGDNIEGKVIDVATRTVTYKKADNLEGPTYTVNKDELVKIVYQNGSEDVFNSMDIRKSKPQKKINYGNNIIAISPIQLNEGVGFGVSYERVIGKKGIVSFYLPATMSFVNADAMASTSSATPVYSNKMYTTYYIMPGVKFYPTGNRGVVRYAVGPSVALVTGKRDVNTLKYDNYGNVIGQYMGPVDRLTIGMMVNNSLNICPTAHLYLGLEMGLGASYIDQEGGKNTGNQNALFQFGFKMGYRF